MSDLLNIYKIWKATVESIERVYVKELKQEHYTLFFDKNKYIDSSYQKLKTDNLSQTNFPIK